MVSDPGLREKIDNLLSIFENNIAGAKIDL